MIGPTSASLRPEYTTNDPRPWTTWHPRYRAAPSVALRSRSSLPWRFRWRRVLPSWHHLSPFRSPLPLRFRRRRSSPFHLPQLLPFHLPQLSLFLSRSPLPSRLLAVSAVATTAAAVVGDGTAVVAGGPPHATRATSSKTANGVIRILLDIWSSNKGLQNTKNDSDISLSLDGYVCIFT